MIDLEVAKTFDRRAALFLTAGAVLTSVLVLRMLQMQVFEYGNYKRKSENNSFRVQINLPARGRILDASGHPISRDIATYRIYIVPEEVPDIDALVAQLAAELNLRQSRVDRIWRTIRRQAKFQPVLISENSDWGTLAAIHAQNLAGVHIDSGFARNYELGPAGAQLFGYTGAPAHSIPNAPFWTEGVVGLEKTFNKDLIGTPGRTVLIANAVGRITGEDKSQFVAGIPGNDIQTTINAGAQKALYDALTTAGAGCGVVLDIQTGDILAMASCPSFDANNFKNDDAEEYIESLRENIAKPFMNKAVEGLYPPGSTFKIVVALAALESGAVSPTEKIRCPGYWDYGDRRFNCWEEKGHGPVDMVGALKHSCDTYFYQIALRIGIDAIKAMANKLGLGDIYLPDIFPREAAGIIPDRYWKERNVGARWVHGDTIISGIGQGFILTNAMQLAIMTARAISNRGVIPRLLKETRDKRQETSLGLQQKNIDIVMRGMEQVMQTGGTAAGSAINVRGQKMAGKTGTSQVRSISRAEREAGVLTDEQLSWHQRNHGLFVGFAPVKNPRFVVATIAEHVGGSGPAARAASAVIKELLKA